MKGSAIALVIGVCLFVGPEISGAARGSSGEPHGGAANEGYITVNGTRLYYVTMGSGDPVVIIHGGPGLDHTYLLPQMAALAATNRLIFFDQRASGKSDAEVDSNSMSIAAFVEDVEGVRKAFGLEKMNLFAHSWGGLVGMFYAIRHPDHLNSLILCNSTPASSSYRMASFKLMREKTSMEDSLAGAAIIASEGFKRRDARVMEKFFKVLFRSGFVDRRYADSITVTLPDDYGARNASIQHLFKDPLATNYDITDSLRVIRCPVLILGGDQDFVPLDADEKIAAAIPGSKFVTLQRCGHFPFIEQKQEFVSTIRSFLSAVPRTAGSR